MGYILKTYSGETVELSDEEGAEIKNFMQSEESDVFIPGKDIFIRKSSISSIMPSNSQYVTVDYKDRNKLPAQHLPYNPPTSLNAGQKQIWSEYMEYRRQQKFNDVVESYKDRELGLMSNIERQYLLNGSVIKETEEGDIICRDKKYIKAMERGREVYKDYPENQENPIILHNEEVITVPETFTGWCEIRRLVSDYNSKKDNENKLEKPENWKKMIHQFVETKNDMFKKSGTPLIPKFETLPDDLESLKSILDTLTKGVYSFTK